MNLRRTLKSRPMHGIVLVEVLVSLLLFSIGVLGLVSIQGGAINAANQSKLRAEAVLIANDLLGQMWVDRANLANYAGTSTLASLPGGTQVVTVASPVVTVTITWRMPGETTDRKHVSTATLVSN